MASLHKDPRGKSPYWYAAFVNSDGKRCFRSTKQREHKKAEVVARGWERAARKGREGVLSEVQCRQVLSDIHEAVNGSPLKFQTAEQYLAEWLAGRKTLSTSSTRIYRNAVNAFLISLGLRKAITITGIGIPDFKRFQDALIDAGKSAATVNLEYGVVRSAFDDARRQQLLLSNPAEAIENLSNESAQRKTFTRDQIKDMLRAADSEWKGMILIGACHGLRISSAAKLTWANVDLQRHTLVFTPHKQRRSRQKVVLEIPMHPDVEAYMLSVKIRGNKPDEPIFPTLTHKRLTGESGLSNIFIKLIGKAGIQREAVSGEVKGVGNTVFDLSFHSLRHTSASELANSGVTMEKRKSLIGHKSDRVHSKYTHLELEALRKELEKMPSFLE